MPTLTTIICTRERPEELRRAVGSVIGQDLGPDENEILVVDNGDVPLERGWLDPRVRVVRTAQVGTPSARNAGLAEARSELVAFMDDDAVAHPGWARSLVGAFDDPRVAAAGGPVVEQWPVARPEWLPSGPPERLFSILDLGDRPRDIVDRIGPIGANMALRRDIAREVGGFPSWLGPFGSYWVGEETHLVELIRAAGHAVRYVPDAVVTHHLAPGRVNRRWLAKRAFAQGRSCTKMDESIATISRGTHMATALRSTGAAVLLGKKELALGEGPLAQRAVLELVRMSRLAGVTVESLRLAGKVGSRTNGEAR